MKQELEIWWSSLPVSEKERIARKGLAAEAKGAEVDESRVLYPECTRWWNGLELARQIKIYAHCVGRHGLVLQEWNDADPYGD